MQALDFSSYVPEWIATVPRWRDYYLEHDQTPHYGYMKRVLKARYPDHYFPGYYGRSLAGVIAHDRELLAGLARDNGGRYVSPDERAR